LENKHSFVLAVSKSASTSLWKRSIATPVVKNTSRKMLRIDDIEVRPQSGFMFEARRLSSRPEYMFELRRLPSRPNQSLEPTATAVTIPAAQEVAPAVAVAHH
jgi:hypothetical protein